MVQEGVAGVVQEGVAGVVQEGMAGVGQKGMAGVIYTGGPQWRRKLFSDGGANFSARAP